MKTMTNPRFLSRRQSTPGSQFSPSGGIAHLEEHGGQQQWVTREVEVVVSCNHIIIYCDYTCQRHINIIMNHIIHEAHNDTVYIID